MKYLNLEKSYLTFKVHRPERHLHADQPEDGGRAGGGVRPAGEEEIHQEGGQAGPPSERRLPAGKVESKRFFTKSEKKTEKIIVSPVFP